MRIVEIREPAFPISSIPSGGLTASAVAVITDGSA
jgi:hypothetical protein